MLNFLLYFSLATVLWLLALVVYVRITPYQELSLAREGNTAASLSLAGTALGLALPLASLAEHAVSLSDLASWALVALAVQLVGWKLFARFVLPGLPQKIEADQLSAGVLLGSFSSCLGLLNAACLTY